MNHFENNHNKPETWKRLSVAQRFERIALELSAAREEAAEGNLFGAGTHVGRAHQFAILGRVELNEKTGKRGPKP